MKKLLIGLFLLTGLLMLVSPGSSQAINYDRGTYGSCQYDTCSISITSNGNVDLDVTPTASGKCTIQNDTVGVLTDNSAGFLLTVANNYPDSALTNGSETISTHSGTYASPSALALGSWGYRIDNNGSFGAGPTSAESNANPGSLTFAGMPNSGQTADSLVQTSVPANPAVDTVVWYGVCANTSVTAGSYATDVTYTAVVNQ